MSQVFLILGQTLFIWTEEGTEGPERERDYLDATQQISCVDGIRIQASQTLAQQAVFLLSSLPSVRVCRNGVHQQVNVGPGQIYWRGHCGQQPWLPGCQAGLPD